MNHVKLVLVGNPRWSRFIYWTNGRHSNNVDRYL